MTVETATESGRAMADGAAGRVARRLALAAAPCFAFMAAVTTVDAVSTAPSNPICAPAGAGLPISGMTWMYLLMSLFHLPPWLRLAAGRAGREHGASQPRGE